MTCLFDHVKPSAFDVDDKIEAKRIFLHKASNTTAVLAEFRTADRVLAGWLTLKGGVNCVDFQVTFNDGFVFYGCYQHPIRNRCKPSLSEYVRTALNVLKAEQAAWLPDLSRYTVDS